jgi:hypothetical protein
MQVQHADGRDAKHLVGNGPREVNADDVVELELTQDAKAILPAEGVADEDARGVEVGAAPQELGGVARAFGKHERQRPVPTSDHEVQHVHRDVSIAGEGEAHAVAVPRHHVSSPR